MVNEESKEYKVRMKVNQLSNQQLRFEVTVRGDTSEETDTLLAEVIEKVKKRCDDHNEALLG